MTKLLLPLKPLSFGSVLNKNALCIIQILTSQYTQNHYIHHCHVIKGARLYFSSIITGRVRLFDYFIFSTYTASTVFSQRINNISQYSLTLVILELDMWPGSFYGRKTGKPKDNAFVKISRIVVTQDVLLFGKI